MKIGIIFYSGTGHTLQVAERLQAKLAEEGHEVSLERVIAEGRPSPTATDVPLEVAPDVTPYDALVIGSPVWGGQPASPMAAYLRWVPTLEGKDVVCLATGFFPAGWGRNQTIARLQEMCEAKGATVRGWGSVGWLSLNRKRQIAEVVGDLSIVF